MKKIIYNFILLLAAVSLTTGCAREEFSNLKKGSGLTFTATIADATRTSIKVEGTSGKVSWVDGDEILINGVAYVATPDTDNPSKVMFYKKNDADADPQTIDGKYYATFACTYDASKVAGELPAVQVCDGDNINAPMYAESTSTSLSFNNICGLFAFGFTATMDETVVKSITVTANENLCGAFELVSGAASLTSGAKSVTIDCGDGVALSTSEATPFYVALPKGTYTGMQFTINFLDEGTQTFKHKNDLAVEANSLYTINLAVESKGGCVARYSNDGGTSWTKAESLAAAISGISTGTAKDQGIVELFHEDAIGAAALPSLAGKKFTLNGNGRKYDVSGRTSEFASDASTDVTFKDLVFDGANKTANAKRLLANKGKVTFEGGEIKDILFKASGNAYGIIVNAGGSAYKDATLTFNGTYIHDCESNGTGAYGFIDNDPGHVVMNGCTVENIKAVGTGSIVRGGFIYNTQTSNIGGRVEITDCSFNGCSATVEGGCISNFAGDVVLNNVTVSGCSAKNGGAISTGKSGTGTRSVTATGCTFTGNTATTYGGMGYFAEGTTTLKDSKVSGANLYVTSGTLNIDNTEVVYTGTGHALLLVGTSSANGTVNVTNGSLIKAPTASVAQAEYGTMNFSDCTLIAKPSNSSYNWTCAPYTSSTMTFDNVIAINRNDNGYVIFSRVSSGTATVKSGYYSSNNITGGNGNITVYGGYFNKDAFAGNGSLAVGLVIEEMTPVDKTVDGTKYTFSYWTKSYDPITPDHTISSFGAYKHVIILGVDGAGAWFSETVTPNVYEICKNGAMCHTVQAATPSLSAQCWTSMLHGVKPEFHTRTNDNTGKEPFDPASPYPSVFRIAREQMPTAKLASFCNWNNVNYGIIEDGIGVVKDHVSNDPGVTDLILDYLKDNDPTLMYVQFDSVDHQGHSTGYGSAAHKASLTAVDALIAKIYNAVAQKGILDETLFLITADHGGTMDTKTHGGSSAVEMNTFLGVAGKTAASATTMVEAEGRDIAAIVAHALGLTAPEVWSSRVPTGVFYDVTGTARKETEIPVSETRKHDMEPTPDLSNMQSLLSGHNVIAYLPFDNSEADAFGTTTVTKKNKVYYYDAYYSQGVDLTDGYLSMSNVTLGKDSFSVAFWINISSVSGDPCVISNKNWGSGNNKGFALSMKTTMLKFNAGTGSARMDLEAAYPLDFDKGWMHVVLVVDRTENKVKVYYDFEEKYSTSITTACQAVAFDSTYPLNIGQDGTGSYGYNFSGAQLDEMIITRDVLTASDIAKMKTYYK